MDFFQRYGAQRAHTGAKPNVTYESRVRNGVLHRVMVWPGLGASPMALCGKNFDGPSDDLSAGQVCLACRGIERRNNKYRGD